MLTDVVVAYLALSNMYQKHGSLSHSRKSSSIAVIPKQTVLLRKRLAHRQMLSASLLHLTNVEQSSKSLDLARSQRTLRSTRTGGRHQIRPWWGANSTRMARLSEKRESFVLSTQKCSLDCTTTSLHRKRQRCLNPFSA